MTEPRLTGDTPPASLAEQIGRTRSSFGRLAGAHVGLLKAEIGEIVDQLKVLGALAGVILALGLLVGNMLYIGGFLFLGEWLFGSIGWGLAHGVLFAIAIIVALVMAILGAPARAPALAFIGAIVVTVAIALLCGSNVGYEAASQVASGLAQPLNSPGVVALLVGALVGAIVFMLVLARAAGRGGAIGGFVLGAFLGGLVGWLIAGAPWTWPPAIGFAITIGLVAWPILTAAFALPGLDPAERFSRLYPKQSIEAFEETRTFLEEQWASRRPMRAKK